MFDIGWSELVVIGVVALIAIGPKELPGALRTLGQWAGKVRRMSAEFQGQFREAMREAEMADIKKAADEASSAMNAFTNFDPLATTTPAVESSVPAPIADQTAEALPPPAEQTSDSPQPEPTTPTVVEASALPPSEPAKTAGGGA